MSSRYPRPREDRLLEAPSSRNAQGLFSPSACVFVGNLNTSIPPEQLEKDLKTCFSFLGPCHPKIKQDKKKGLPGAFIQFEHVDHALAALELKNQKLHGRTLRIEPSKAKCSAVLGLLSGADITQEDVEFVLANRGPIISKLMAPACIQDQVGPWVCRVKFAYVDDCRDAIKDLQKNEMYYMELLDSGSHQIVHHTGYQQPCPRRSYNAGPARNGNDYRGNSYRGRRYAYGSSRGGRGFSTPSRASFHRRIPLYHGPPDSSFEPNGIPYGNESQVAFYPPLYHPAVYDKPPFMIPPQPDFSNPPPVVPPSSLPCIVHSQPVYPPEHMWCGPYPPSNGVISTPSSIYSQPSGYFSTPSFTGVYPATPEHSIPPVNINTALPPASTDVPVEPEETSQSPEPVVPQTPETESVSGEESGGDDYIAKLLDRTNPEKAPSLVRINGSNDAHEESRTEEQPVANDRRSSSLIPVLDSVPEFASEEESVNDAQHTDNIVNSTGASTTDPEESNDDSSTVQGVQKTPSHISSKCDSSRTPHQMHDSHDRTAVVPGIPWMPKSKLKGYVKGEAKRLGIDINESDLEEVVEEMAQEMPEKKQETPQISYPDSGSDGSLGSRSPSISRSCSSLSA
ncbi:hypothetical protein N7512_007309 [Penicillium capsulatum]|nr:hypothetical protein N7512_007309 [Penicillium capsulatum]